MQDLIIQPQAGKKGRSFRATRVAAVTADALFPEGGSGDTIRPVWAMFAGSDAELRPFAANLRLGRKAELDAERWSRRGGDTNRYEFLKSVGYGMAWQKEAEGSLVTFYHPELFRLDPGMVDPAGVSFAMLVPDEWAKAQTIDVSEPVKHVSRIIRSRNLDFTFTEDWLATLAPIAYLFAAYVDRRTRCPLLADGRFYLQILIAALHYGFASLPGNNLSPGYQREEWGINKTHCFNADGLEQIGVSYAFSVKASHTEIEGFLAEQVSWFFDLRGDFVSLSQRVDLSAFEEML